MFRLVQVSARALGRAAPSAGCSSSAAFAARAGFRPPRVGAGQQPLVFVSSLRYKHQSSSTGSQGGDKGKNKKTLMDKANETLENAGLKTRSKSGGAGPTPAGAPTKKSTGDGHKGGPTDKPKSGGSSADKSSSSSSSGKRTNRAGVPVPNVDCHKPKMNRSSHPTRTFDLSKCGPVRHDPKAKQFVLDLGNNQLARIEYKKCGDGRLDFYHTEVPEALRGQGIGRALAKGALESAEKSNLKLRVTCDYLKNYMRQYADERHKKLVEGY